MTLRGPPTSSERITVDGVFRKALLLSPRGQVELYVMLRERLADVAAPASEADEGIDRRRAAVEAMEQVAAALDLPVGTAPTSTQFTEQTRALGLDWTVSKLVRLFKGWSNAQKFYENRRLPETARQVSQRRYIAAPRRTSLDHLAEVAEWLDGKPPDTSRLAYDEWRNTYNRANAASEESLPAHSRHLRRLFPELTWQDMLNAAQDEHADPWTLSRQRAEERLRTELNPLGLVSVGTAAALLGMTVFRFESARTSERPGFPQMFGFVGRCRCRLNTGPSAPV